MHEKVHRYLELERKLDNPNFLSRIRLAADAVLQPISHLMFWLCLWFFPSVLLQFGYTETPSTFQFVFYVVTTIQVLLECVHTWKTLFEFYDLGTFFLVKHIKYARNRPYYHIQSSHPSHQLFKYAAFTALERR